MTTGLLSPLDDVPSAVRTHGLVRRFGTRVALDGLDLTVPEGAVYVLVGPNGAGKTTTLRIFLGLARADAGEVTLFGRDPVAEGAVVRAAIGYVPEAHDFGYGQLVVGQLLRYHATYFPHWDEAYAAHLISRLEVDKAARFGALSKGQARRVQLILALAHRPPLLLLDEPTDGLDPLARDRVFELLAAHLAASPTTVLLSTHLVHEVEGLGDCLGVLRKGKLIAQARREDLAQRLHRVRAEVPVNWPGMPELRATIVRRRDQGREIAWTLWGEGEAIDRALTASGATLRDRAPLNLEDASRDLLAMEEAR